MEQTSSLTYLWHIIAGQLEFWPTPANIRPNSSDQLKTSTTDDRQRSPITSDRRRLVTFSGRVEGDQLVAISSWRKWRPAFSDQLRWTSSKHSTKFRRSSRNFNDWSTVAGRVRPKNAGGLLMQWRRRPSCSSSPSTRDDNQLVPWSPFAWPEKATSLLRLDVTRSPVVDVLS